MVQFEGDQAFPLAPETVAAKLSDAAFLIDCLPDAEQPTATPDRGHFRLRPKLSFVTGHLDITLEVTDREPGRSAGFKIFSKAIGATSTVLARMEFRPDGDGTAVHWGGMISEVTGLLKMVPKGLMQATAQKVIEDVWAAIRARLVPG